jgi:hypothetical protein
MLSQDYTNAVETAAEEWPAEARMILSAIQAADPGPPAGLAGTERRGKPRYEYQVRAFLRLFSDPDGSAPWKLYTRDASARSLGFITPHRLPLGYGGVVELPGPEGQSVSAHCTLFRCRQTVSGWYEGALSFHRLQPVLGLEPPPDEDETD